MPLVYKQCNSADAVAHVCDPCLTAEKGNVRSIILIKEGTAITDKSTPQEWTAAIEAGNVIIVPETRGTYDGGAPKMIPGYGDKKEVVSGFDFTSAVKDPNYKQNVSFWSWAEKQRWRYGFRTESLIHLTEKTVTISAKAPVEEDVESDVIWNIEIKWFDTVKPKVFDFAPLKDLFKCFSVENGG